MEVEYSDGKEAGRILCQSCAGLDFKLYFNDDRTATAECSRCKLRFDLTKEVNEIVDDIERREKE